MKNVVFNLRNHRMCMSDRPTVDVDIFVDALPAHVWAVVTDLNGMGHGKVSRQ
ncbi:MAG: hypothetical protein O7G88_19770 [bacterium]|nr:hypothetical protein [bacterium]